MATLLSAQVLLAPLSSWAATDEEKAGARAAAVEGLKAFEEGRWSDVVDLFTRAEALVHSPVHLLYLGRANLKLGKLVLAREELMKAAREHVEPDSPPAFERAKSEAQAELPAIEPRVPYLTLKVEGAPLTAITVTMDGVKVPTPLIGLARPVDPGDHKFEASGPGVSAEPLVVTLAESERKSATFTVHYTAVAEGAAPAAGPASTTPAGGPQPAGPQGADVAPASASPNNGLRIASYAAFGVGAVGLGMGIGFGLKAKGNRSDANALCDARGCPDSKASQINSLDDSANSANKLAIVGFALGGVGIAAGATLFVLSNGKKTEPTAAYVHPWVGVGSAGVSGRF